jgi:hypothetical protein
MNITDKALRSPANLCGIGLILGYLIVFYQGMEDSFILIHDNLTASVAWYRALAASGLSYFSLNVEVPNALNGLPLSSVSPGFSIGESMFLLFRPIVAIVVNELIVRVVAFAGMSVLLKRHLLKEASSDAAVIGVSACFALLPFFPGGFLSVAGIPLVVFAFLNILTGNGRWTDWGIVCLMPFYTVLVYSGFGICLLMGILWIGNWAHSRKVNWAALTAILLTVGLYLAANYRLIYTFFFDAGYVSHRSVWITPHYGLRKAAKYTLDNFLNGDFFAASLHRYFMLFAVILGAFFTAAVPEERKNRRFIGVVSAIGLISVFFGFWGVVKLHLPDAFFIRSFQWHRINWLHPPLWYAAFALALPLIQRHVAKGKYLVFILVIGQLGYNIVNAYPLREQRRGANVTFRQFYSEPLFRSISDYIAQPQASYRVMSIGLYSAVALYNGFYTLDGYFASYPLSYKNKFRQVIEKELEKNSGIKLFFDNYGSACYALTAETGKNSFIRKNDGITIRNLQLNIPALKALGGRYILSAVEIENHRENHLRFHRMFEHRESPYRIYLYEIL